MRSLCGKQRQTMNTFYANYHTHTRRCGHAEGTEEDYIRAALSGGWKILGFSDHVPWPYAGGFQNPTVRMPIGELEDYVASLRLLREKYRDELKIYIGFECEYFPEYISWLRETKEKYALDHLILGNHFEDTDENGGFYYGGCSEARHIIGYTERVLRGMETGLFCCLAHPELFLKDYPAFDATAKDCAREILTAAKEKHLPVEYNLQGFRISAKGRSAGVGYPYRGFWELAAEIGSTAVIGMDAHAPEELLEEEPYAAAQALLAELGVPVLKTLKGLT